jgi:hypothetical protein
MEVARSTSAIAGGRPRPEGDRRFYDARDPGLLSSLLSDITRDLARCVFAVPIPPGPEDEVEVLLDGAIVPQDELRTNGWDWTSDERGQLALRRRVRARDRHGRHRSRDHHVPLVAWKCESRTIRTAESAEARRDFVLSALSALSAVVRKATTCYKLSIQGPRGATDEDFERVRRGEHRRDRRHDPSRVRLRIRRDAGERSCSGSTSASRARRACRSRS